ncbi:MAG: homocysteine S-methyltransferase [Chloroflexi bacterium]|nr:homocysteine S-methyltransferase [Chloroflexota bacterium]
MNPIAHILNDYPLMILDGALATELEQRGCDLRDPLWSAKVLIEAPHLIQQVHADYFAAGADCATTASYQATFQGFARRGLSETEAAGLMQLAVRLAVEARDEFWANPINRVGRPKPLVAASIGSYGAFLADGSEYSGNYGLSERELIDFHRPRLAVLAKTEADLLACETIPCLVEAQALAHLLTEFPERWAWISFSAKDSAHISHGEPLADCVATLNQSVQVAAVGVNCTAPCYVADLVSAARSATTKPILVYPNSGEIYRPENSTWRGTREVSTSAEEAHKWYERGARIIGGCCRTTPAQIQAIASWARGLKALANYTKSSD